MALGQLPQCCEFLHVTGPSRREVTTAYAESITLINGLHSASELGSLLVEQPKCKAYFK